MKKKIITITAPVAIIESISILMIAMIPQNRVMEHLVLKTIKEPVSICLN